MESIFRLILIVAILYVLLQIQNILYNDQHKNINNTKNNNFIADANVTAPTKSTQTNGFFKELISNTGNTITLPDQITLTTS